MIKTFDDATHIAVPLNEWMNRPRGLKEQADYIAALKEQIKALEAAAIARTCAAPA